MGTKKLEGRKEGGKEGASNKQQLPQPTNGISILFICRRYCNAKCHAKPRQEMKKEGTRENASFQT